VFLKSLTLKGFKSFADATTMELEPGVTVVVGPNGSGKSNVVDAIAWVLGAQAPSAVRSQKMDDVIFAGTASRPALGRAEVTLTIDNAAGLLGIDVSEVSVSRTLFRTGDSEYAINGVPCRLLDVQELLSDAGVGRQQHVLVSQGQIDAVLNARPEERRAIVEEAAGVLKYRKRKEKAERRLEATEASLLRVQDLLREVRRQLRPLERQADAARRHGDLIVELTGLRTHVAGREIAALRTRLTSLAAARFDGANAERQLKERLGALDTDVIAVGAELTARGADDVGDRLARVERLRERARGLLAVIGERRRSLEREQLHVLDTDTMAALDAESVRLRSELDDVLAELETGVPAVETLAADERALATDRAQSDDVPPDRLGVATAASALAEVRGELRSRRAAIERGEAERDVLDARGRELVARLDALGADTDRLRHDCDAAELAEAPLVDEIDRASATRAAAEAEVADAEAVERDAAQRVAAGCARVEALQLALDAARARAGAERLSAVDGVLGTLLDLVRIDHGWEAAVEAALGEALAAVVVTDAHAARRALGELRHAGASGAVLALGLDRDVTDPRPPPAGEPVRPHVQADRPDVTAALDVLLARSVRAADLDAAITVATTDPAVVVTAAGDRLGAGGWRVGAASGGATAAALDEAVDRFAAAEAALRDAHLGREAAAATLAGARRREGDLVARLDANDATFTAASESLARIQADRRQVLAEQETLDRRGAVVDDDLRAEVERVAELERLVPNLEAGEAEAADQARVRHQTLADLTDRAAELSARRRDLDVRMASLGERRQLLDRRLGEVERRLAADRDARAGAADRRRSLEHTLDVLGGLGDVVDRAWAATDAHHGELVERRRQQTDDVRDLSARLDALRAARADAERQLEGTRERSRRSELDDAEARVRLETAVETVRRDLDVEPEVAEAAPLPELPDGVSAPARVRELERELRLLGPINPLALEEFVELQQRHGFLEEQLDDVRTTRRELAKVITAVDEEIMTVFAGAYIDVCEHFTALFTTLFPGGSGRLVLTDPDDLLSTGIEIEARPGGKNVKKLSLLSGGERSLTALAFLFAVFRSRPSPFYVMDEVEAALDDVNLHRFLDLLGEFRRDAQLLVVSHQKRTMEAGDCLLGVTMQPGGSSRVIVERVAAPV